jgi:hypothetical protein
LIRNTRVSTLLLTEWLKYFGGVFFDETDLEDEEMSMLSSSLNIDIPNKKISVCKYSFLKTQFDNIFGQIVNVYFDINTTTAFMYCKILLGYAFQFDPIIALEHVTTLYWSCMFFTKDPLLDFPREDSLSYIIDLSDLLHAVALCITSSDTECILNTLNLHGKCPASVTNNILTLI